MKRWTGQITCTGETRNSYKILVTKSEARGLLGRLRDRVEDNIKTDLKVEGFDYVDFIRLIQDSVHLQATLYKTLKFPAP
jgi:hypothetical protein